jgi:hypothetical protein
MKQTERLFRKLMTFNLNMTQSRVVLGLSEPKLYSAAEGPSVKFRQAV